MDFCFLPACPSLHRTFESRVTMVAGTQATGSGICDQGR
ncbi:hypothetical protein RISK_005130 [Rhodopirellula islandica]|uniref:Uncharacterized protein n=1 Tax=Rhodopirellula islandica TaxID=595434 RepID=A0A0J1EB70_RHOIS|nr:hypothetical protein RISK_005130 [Rhodopirellula islandica]